VNVIEAQGLGKRYGRTWALRGCRVSIPEGRVAALVGPNGAGKTTFLNLVVGLVAASEGTVGVMNGLAPGSPVALAQIAFVAQDAPLYPNLSVADTVHLAANLNDHFDHQAARRRLSSLEIPMRQKVGKLSGGQHAQVALALSLARHPRLLVLDEPVARLDPLARHDVMASLMEAVVAEGMSVLLSSHVVAELERVCDYLVLVSKGSVQVAGDVDTLVSEHRVLTGPTEGVDHIRGITSVVREWRSERQSTLLVRDTGQTALPLGWHASATGLEELILSYLRATDAQALPGPSAYAGAAS
jgi:ABC-2 type transport system ATP-binding protein